MGREARATARLTPAERQLRRLHRTARGVRNLRVLYDGMRGINRSDREAILEQIRPCLTFPVSDAEWAWLRQKLGLTEGVVGGSDGDSAAGDGDGAEPPESGAV
jgi:hypothetical protein